MKILRIFFLLFCLLLPFAFNLQNSDSPFEQFKFLFSGIYLSILAVIFLTGVSRKKQYRFEISVATAVTLLIAASNLLSYLFSVNPYLSLWGDNLLPSDGVVSVLIFVASAFICEQIFGKEKRQWIAATLLLALGGQVLYGLLQSFGFDFYSWNYAKPVFGTFGSTVSYSSFIGCLVPVAICCFFSIDKLFLKALLFFLILASNYLLLETGSRAPAAAGLLVQLILFFYFFRKSPTFKSRSSVAAIFACVICLYGLSFLKPAEKETLVYKLAPVEISRGAEVRKLLWKESLTAWKEHPFLGYGPETFPIAQRSVQSAEMNQFDKWHSSWTKAHNHLIHYLVSLGVLGLLAHLLLFGYVVRNVTKIFSTADAGREVNLSLGFGFGFIFLFIANLTGFNFITTEFFYFLFPVLAAGRHSESFYTLDFSKMKNAFKVLILALMALFLLLAFKISSHFRGDVLYQMSFAALNKNKEVQVALLLGEEAIKANAQEPAYHCHMSQIATQMLLDGGQISNEVKGYIHDSMNTEAELCRETALNRDHYFLQVANQYGQLFTAGLLPTPEKSLENFETMMTLAPNVPLAYYRSALIYLKSGNSTAFEENMEKTLELKANYMPAFVELFQFYYQTKNMEKKYQLLERFSDLKTPPTELPELVNALADMAKQNNDSQAREIFLKKSAEFSGAH